MKKQGSSIILVLTVMLFAIAMTLAALAVFMKSTGRIVAFEEDVATEPQDAEGMDKLIEIESLIKDEFLMEYDDEAMKDAVYRAMLDSLGDKYSRYLSKEELEQLQQDISSSYVGTGIVFIDNAPGEGFLITDVVQGGPADVAGLEGGDIILEVDGKAYDSAEELTAALKGDAGKEVKIKVLRGDEEETFSLVRGDVVGASVESRELKDGIGYIRIRSFGTDTATLFETALSGFEKNKAKGLILDLRDNGGGIFEEGVKIADRLLPECLISYTEDKGGNRENYNSDSQKTSLNVVVLINENTGSTAEMVAAALKDSGDIKVVGTKTYGKGLIQKSHPFTDGTAVNITVYEFFTPKGEKINEKGISPDVTVQPSSKEGEDLQLDKGMELLNKAA